MVGKTKHENCDGVVHIWRLAVYWIRFSCFWLRDRGMVVVVVVVVVVFRMPGVGCTSRSERPKDRIRLNARWAWKRCAGRWSFPSTSCFRCVLKALIAVEFQAGQALRCAICNMEPTDERLTRRPKGSGANRA
ncbi:hypothetical protein GE21DRAFT_1002832 [Neurospora crassa]|nr:hypothetical protein GE21DRAFT_1002832 [Neurospora crassa]